MPRPDPYIPLPQSSQATAQPWPGNFVEDVYMDGFLGWFPDEVVRIWAPGMVSRRSCDEFGLLAGFPDEVVRIWAPVMVSRRSCNEFRLLGWCRDG